MSIPKCDEFGEKLPESVWLQHKDTLYRLYIVENKRLSLVKQTMEDQYAFPPQRPCDYEVALRDVLHFRKNLKREEWRAIAMRISNRKRQSKESEVIWNNARFEAKKLRKELLRNSQPKSSLVRKATPELPHGLVIRTPPQSPIACATVLFPSLEPQLKSIPTNSPQAVSRGVNHSIISSSVVFEDIWEVQRALVEAGELDVSPYRKLRENLPFNRCMSQFLDLAQSRPLHLCIPTAETWAPAFPRLFGANPSWELFGRQIFTLSNNPYINYRHQEDVWFLKWIGISADFALLRAFFSINSPTAGAVYESLLENAGRLRITDLVRVLFGLRHVLRTNNPTSFNHDVFVRVAANIDSRSGSSLDIVKTCLSNMLPLSIAKHHESRHWTSSSVLRAASRCDIAMLHILVNAGWKIEDLPFGFQSEEISRVMSHIYNWNSQQKQDITTYIELLLRGGVLNGSAFPQYSHDHRPQAVSGTRDISSITWDELVMLCPPTMRKSLQMTLTRLIGGLETCISRAEIFTIAQEGANGLRAYLKAHRKDDAFLTRVTLEECLLSSATLNDSKTASVLLEIGVDPYIGLLSSHFEGYQNGNFSWTPSIVAAGTGHLEVLKLLLDHQNLSSFLKFSPIHQLVQQKMFWEKSNETAVGRGLRRLNNLHESYLELETRNSKPAAERSPDGLWNTPIKIATSLETLEYIRSIAYSRGFGKKVDLDIIKAATFHLDWLPTHRLDLPSEALLMQGLVDANVEYKEEGMDLLHLSIRSHCSFAVVRFLSSKGFKVHSNPGTQSHNSMLHDALLSASPDRSEIVNFLLEEGASCEFCGEGLTILEASLWNCHPVEHKPEYQRLFEQLLDAGAPVHPWPRKRLSQWRPLITLLLNVHASDDLILRVVDAGAPLNACGYGNNASVHQFENATPLQAAIIHRRESLARELIRRGADVHAPGSPLYGLTALQAACSSDFPIHFLAYIVNVLGVNVNEPPSQIMGFTSLAVAVYQASLNTIEFLLDHGADINATCRLGLETIVPYDGNLSVRPLDLAVRNGHLDMVELLLKAGGRSRKAGLGGAMSIAASRGHFAVLSLLRNWDEKHGRRILEEEALWQRRNPEQVLMMSQPTDDPSYVDHEESGDCDEGEGYDESRDVFTTAED